MTKQTITLFALFAVIVFIGAGCLQPKEKNLDVPFVSQAPEGNWFEPWLNACEETSIFMIDAYYTGEEEISTEEAKENIREIFTLKTQEIDSSLDESMQTVKELIDLLDLSWTAEVVENPTADQLIQEIANNRPVIVPIYAPKLYGTNDSVAGPDYHVVVLVGYNDETSEFILNDPAHASDTEPRFSYEVLMEAIHDLDQAEYTEGGKAVLFTKRK